MQPSSTVPSQSLSVPSQTSALSPLWSPHVRCPLTQASVPSRQASGSGPSHWAPNQASPLPSGVVGSQSSSVPSQVSAALHTVHRREAGVGSRLPAPSRARTSKVCAADERPARTNGLEQAANAAPSSLHSNEAGASFEANSKVASAARTMPLGPETISVSGGMRSAGSWMVQVRVAWV